MLYLLAFGLAFAVSAAATPFVRRLALNYGIVDRPTESRKIHKQPIAYLGGLAIFISFIVVVSAMLPLSRQLFSLLMACLVLVSVGVIDDARGLSHWTKLIWQFGAAGIALSGGIGITSFTNPFGGVIDLTYGRFAIDLLGLHFHIAPIANAISLIWMVGLANTINFLDGLDGLACGVSGIAAFIIFLLSVGAKDQMAVALLAIILAGAAIGFLPFNFHPARIFMGDSGALFLGLTLAMLSIYSGAKLATAALVLGFPILDAGLVAIRRLAKGRSPLRGDRNHFHHLLLGAGLSQRQAVLLFYAISATFGLAALAIGSFGKLVALGVLSGLMIVSITTLLLINRTKQRKLVSN